MKIVGLLGAKKYSKRLEGKGWRDFGGKPMFEWNVRKGLQVFDKMYVSSDYDYILEEIADMGAIPIKRESPYLMEAPNIVWYRHAMKHMDNPDVLIALQVNSPTVSKGLIWMIKNMMEYYKLDEIKTCHPDYTDYGSVWAISKKRLFQYKNFHKFTPDVYVVDSSQDIHNLEDFKEALCQIKKY